jgi:trimeric autotransporter adhesin
MKTKVPSFIVTILISWLSQSAHAVSPPPDGGYPGANTAEGDDALLALGPGIYNTAVGFDSLEKNIGGSFNTAVGAATLFFNNGNENTAIGAGALLSNGVTFPASGNANTATGAFTLFNNSSGSLNTALGDRALVNNINGSNNIAIGASAGSNVTTASNVISIGLPGFNQSNTCFIGSIFGSTVSQGIPVLISSNSRLGTSTSSRRFKEEIKPMEQVSEAIFALKPVTFRYKKDIDSEGTPQLGLVAEDVEKVNPDLVVRDKEGKAYSVRYDQVNAMLLNEFLKEHRTVQEQKATIAELKQNFAQQQKQIEALTAGLQKVSAQVEANRTAPQLVGNNR